MSHCAPILTWFVLLSACSTGPLVRPGLDVLLTDSTHLVAARRVGLLANHAAVDQRGVEALVRLREAGVHVTALFAPEHGWRGQLDTENIGHGIDSATGLPVFSLYGETREPTPAMLAEVDVIVIDLPDIGARPFTYVSSALRTVRAAGAVGVEVVILDRPNPINGLQVQGPVQDSATASFIAMLPLPQRHGMTLGELVRFGRAILGLETTMHVVPAAGWTRGLWLDETGLPWVRPSPNMPSLESATHYPGLVLFEATALSVGRGTPIAFQVLGAPWLDAAGLAAALAEVPGLAASDTTVTPVDPTDRKHPGLSLPAVRFRVTDRATYDPVAAAAVALDWIRRNHGDSLRINAARFDQLAGGSGLREALVSGQPPSAIRASWEPALQRFRTARAPYLLY